MRHFAVVGNPVAHSRSPDIHQGFAKSLGFVISYERIQSDSLSADLPDYAHKYSGINVTVPFKYDAFTLCDAFGIRLAGKDAQDSGAVNTLQFVEQQVIGYNTDGIGLVRDFASLGVCLAEKSILMIGAGGACAGILPAILRENPAEILIGNRTKNKAFELLNKHHKKGCQKMNATSLSELSTLSSAPDVIINTTSAGLSEKMLNLPHSLFSKAQFIYDLCYDIGKPTLFLSETEQYNIPQSDGYGMLVAQARESFNIWHDLT